MVCATNKTLKNSETKEMKYKKIYFVCEQITKFVFLGKKIGKTGESRFSTNHTNSFQ